MKDSDLEKLSALKTELLKEGDEIISVHVPQEKREYGSSEGAKELTYILDVTDALSEALSGKGVELADKVLRNRDEEEVLLTKKTELHLTCLGFPHIARLEEATSRYPGDRDGFKKKVSQILSQTDFSFEVEMNSLKEIVNLQYDPQKVKQGESFESQSTIIVDTKTDSIQNFYLEMGKEFGVDLGDSAAHATLYIQEQSDATTKGLGIAVMDIEEQKHGPVGSAPHIKINDLDWRDVSSSSQEDKNLELSSLSPEDFGSLKSFLTEMSSDYIYSESYHYDDYYGLSAGEAKKSEEVNRNNIRQRYTELFDQCENISDFFKQSPDTIGEVLYENGNNLEEHVLKEVINSFVDFACDTENENNELDNNKFPFAKLFSKYNDIYPQEEISERTNQLARSKRYPIIFKLLDNLDSDNQKKALRVLAEDGKDFVISNKITSISGLDIETVKLLAPFPAKNDFFSKREWDKSKEITGFEMFGANLHHVKNPQLATDIANFVVTKRGIEGITLPHINDSRTYDSGTQPAMEVRKRHDRRIEQLKDLIDYNSLVELDHMVKLDPNFNPKEGDQILEEKELEQARKIVDERMLTEKKLSKNQERIENMSNKFSRKKLKDFEALLNGRTEGISSDSMSFFRKNYLTHYEDEYDLSESFPNVIVSEYGKKVYEQILKNRRK